MRAGMTHDQAADALGCRQPKISKIEHAAITVNSDDVRTLAEAYAKVESLARLAHEAKRRGWWHIYGDAMTTRTVPR